MTSVLMTQAEAYSLWPSPNQIDVVEPPDLSYPPTQKSLNTWNFVTPHTPAVRNKVSK